MTQLNLWTVIAVLVLGLIVSLKMRFPVGQLISLAGVWVIVIGVTLFDLGASKPASLATLADIFLLLTFGVLLIVGGLGMILLGFGIHGWHKSTREVKYGHLRTRRNSSLEYPCIDGRPTLIITPKKPGQAQLELVRLDADWPSRDFPSLN